MQKCPHSLPPLSNINRIVFHVDVFLMSHTHMVIHEYLFNMAWSNVIRNSKLHPDFDHGYATNFAFVDSPEVLLVMFLLCDQICLQIRSSTIFFPVHFGTSAHALVHFNRDFLFGLIDFST